VRLETDEIARAFLVPAPTMAQRLVRAKAKIQQARIPYRVPDAEDLPERIDAVLAVVYLVFNEGYAASAGAALIRRELCAEAIRLARLLVELLPGESEARALLALMLLTDARRDARVDAAGEMVLLEDQDRARWDRGAIREGLSLVEAALRAGPPGSYALQAAIAGVHARAAHRRGHGLARDRRAVRAAPDRAPVGRRRAEPRGGGRDGGRARGGPAAHGRARRRRKPGGLPPAAGGARGSAAAAGAIVGGRGGVPRGARARRE
jgi:hypothetical protein